MHGWGDRLKMVAAWPSDESIGKLLNELGLDLVEPHLAPLGARTAEIVGLAREGKEPVRICVARLRDHDPRVVCPLTEERDILRQLHALAPGLAPEPLGLIVLATGEAFMVLKWIVGSRLGNQFNLGEDFATFYSIIVSALKRLHLVGRQCALSAVTRQISVERLLQAVGSSPLRGVVLSATDWDRTLGAACEAARELGSPTLLHGDAHIYNLLETPQGWCLLDFELLAVGPPEFDYARAWALLQAQAVRLDHSATRAVPQLACDFLVIAELLLNPMCTHSKKVRYVMEQALRTVAAGLISSDARLSWDWAVHHTVK
ncbi:MAG: phosphotransferase family protein [Desulfuromonadaceae bacterium]